MDWEEPTAAVEMAADGIMLFSPTDMTRCWPKVWANERAARRTLAETAAVETAARRFAGVPAEVADTSLVSTLTRDLSVTSPTFSFPLPRAAIVFYQPAGSGRRPRPGLVDLAVEPDPAGWLAERLGPLAQCHVFAVSPGVAEAAE